MAELPLNDAELRAVRAHIVARAKVGIDEASRIAGDYDANVAAIDAARAALPAPTPEPEIVLENERLGWAVRRGTMYFGMGGWDRQVFTYSRKQAELIAEALRAREKAQVPK